MTGQNPPQTPHLMVGTPCYGGNVTHLYMTSMMQLQKLCLVRGIPFELLLLSGDALITRARNTVVTTFLDNRSATHLMFIDADIGFDANKVFEMLELDVDVVGGIYPSKTINWDAGAGSGAAGPSRPSRRLDELRRRLCRSPEGREPE